MKKKNEKLVDYNTQNIDMSYLKIVYIYLPKSTARSLKSIIVLIMRNVNVSLNYFMRLLDELHNCRYINITFPLP